MQTRAFEVLVASSQRIALMRDLAPGYLQHFVSYVDDLSSLEQLGRGASAAPRDVPQAATIGKRPRAKARTRRE